MCCGNAGSLFAGCMGHRGDQLLGLYQVHSRPPFLSAQCWWCVRAVHSAVHFAVQSIWALHWYCLPVFLCVKPYVLLPCMHLVVPPSAATCAAHTAEVKQLEEKGELEDGDPLNSFFKKIFSQVCEGSSSNSGSYGCVARYGSAALHMLAQGQQVC